MRLIRDTDLIYLDRELRVRLCAASTDPELLDLLLREPTLPVFGSHQDPGCILFQPEDGSTQITVRVRGFSQPKIASVHRVAFALAVAHRRMHLTPQDLVLTLCGRIGARNTGHGCCLNPAHLRPAIDAEIVAMRVSRTKLIRLGVSVKATSGVNRVLVKRIISGEHYTCRS